MASNDKLRDEIGELFEEFVIPKNVFLVLQSKNILTKQDIDTVGSRICNNSTSEGARLLLDIIVQKKDWFRHLQTVLRDESVKLWHIAEIMMQEKNRIQRQSASYQRSSIRTRADNSGPVTLSALYIKYNRDLEHKIRELFVEKICDPVLVLRVFQMCSNAKILTKIDCDNVKAEVNNKGACEGAVLLFSRLVLYDTWLDVLLQTLKHDDIRLQDMAKEIESSTRKITEDYETGRSRIQHQVTMDLSLLLVGRDGNGKSSTGNSILGGKPFTPTSNCSSVGVEIQQASATVSKRKVIVTEVAGLEYPDADIEGDLEDTLRKIKETITENKNGFNAVIFVLKFGVRFTKQNKDALLMIKSIFGSNVIKDFGVVVMTNGDCFDSDVGQDKQTFEEWCQGQTGEVRTLFDDCEGCVLFNNRTKDEYKMEVQRQLLFSMVTEIGRLYTLDEYNKAVKGQTEIVVQSKLPKVEQHKNNVMKFGQN